MECRNDFWRNFTQLLQSAGYKHTIAAFKILNLNVTSFWCKKYLLFTEFYFLWGSISPILICYYILTSTLLCYYECAYYFNSSLFTNKSPKMLKSDSDDIAQNHILTDLTDQCHKRGWVLIQYLNKKAIPPNFH